MKRAFAGLVATLALGTGFLASEAFALAVNWDINPAESSFKLTVPDQPITLGTVSGTMRLRNQNNTTWTQNNAPVDGLLATNVTGTPGVVSTVEFLGGSSSLTGVNTGSYRPNPAAYNTNVTDTINTAGTFTNTTGADGVYAARVNVSVSIITTNAGYIAFRDMEFDVASAVTAVSVGSFNLAGIDIGILDSEIGFDDVGGSTTAIGDTIGNTGPIAATVVAGAGTIVNIGGDNWKITIPFTMPVMVDLAGVMLNATASGSMVGYATFVVPEPATFALTALGVAGLAAYGRRRRQA